MFVPWGELDWVTRRLSKRDWGYLGCISHEDRSLAAVGLRQFTASKCRMVRIFDADPVDFEAERHSLDNKTEQVLKNGLAASQISDYSLLATLDEMSDVLAELRTLSNSLLLDITSFPKRWFFPLIRMAIQDFDFDDIMALYTEAASYGQVLSFNPEAIRALPSFTSMSRRTTCDVAFVSVGYHSHSVLDLFDVERPRSLKLLFPFPPGPPGVSRNWSFVERLERSIKTEELLRGLGTKALEEVRIGALDLPQNFLALMKATDGGEKTSLVAPFGPKPVSLAMCLFSLASEFSGKSEVPAYYSQPMRYSSDYSSGVALKLGKPSIFGYPIKIDRKNLYF